jgi:hypothetical protein
MYREEPMPVPENSTLLIAFNAFTDDGIVRLATNAEILAQPCVVAALNKRTQAAIRWRFQCGEFTPAPDEVSWLLAQPCVQAAIKEARDGGRVDGAGLYVPVSDEAGAWWRSATDEEVLAYPAAVAALEAARKAAFDKALDLIETHLAVNGEEADAAEEAKDFDEMSILDGVGVGLASARRAIRRLRDAAGGGS